MKWFVCVLAFGFAVNMPGWAAKMGQEKQPKTPPLHHLVDIAVPDSMQLDSRLPLQTDRMLKCPVCHGIEDIDKQDFAKIDKKHPDFLRDGPYPDLNQFCYRCHDEEKHRRANIHDMLDAQDKPKEEYCRYCHREVLERDQRYELSELKLRAPMDKLCYGCHLKTPHFNALEHQVEPSKKVKKQREHFLQEHPEVILPLTEDHRVTCITCHTPHPPGVIDTSLPAAHHVSTAKVNEAPRYRDSLWKETIAEDKALRLAAISARYGRPLTYDYQQIQGEALLRLAAKDGTLCRACHTFVD